MAEVKVQEGESIESALRRFKRKVQQEDIIKDIKKHSYYLKPGDRRRAKQALARKRTRKKQRRESDYRLRSSCEYRKRGRISIFVAGDTTEIEVRPFFHRACPRVQAQSW